MNVGPTRDIALLAAAGQLAGRRPSAVTADGTVAGPGHQDLPPSAEERPPASGRAPGVTQAAPKISSAGAVSPSRDGHRGWPAGS
jgi:hypothetical protein